MEEWERNDFFFLCIKDMEIGFIERFLSKSLFEEGKKIVEEIRGLFYS